MEDISVFQDKSIEPADHDLEVKLGRSYDWWKNLSNLALQKCPGAWAEWNYPGKKYGWSFRVKDKKRAIIYLLPRDGHFKVALVFGQKAVDAVLESAVSPGIKDQLRQAVPYAEGRGIRIEVNDVSILSDIERLIDIKLRM